VPATCSTATAGATTRWCARRATHSYTIGLVLLCATATAALVYTLVGIKERAASAGRREPP
jgi:hypothetical protein